MDGAPFGFIQSARVECSCCHVQAECGSFSVAYGAPQPRPTLPRGWSIYLDIDGIQRVLCSLHRVEQRVVDLCPCGDPRCPGKPFERIVIHSWDPYPSCTATPYDTHGN